MTCKHAIFPTHLLRERPVRWRKNFNSGLTRYRMQVTHVLHQWGWESQIQAAKQLAKYTKPGSIIIGYQAGTAGGATKEVGESEWHSWMRQDPESWAEMWDVVGKDTGTNWKSDAVLAPFGEIGVRDKDVEYLVPLARILRFVVTRIE